MMFRFLCSSLVSAPFTFLSLLLQLELCLRQQLPLCHRRMPSLTVIASSNYAVATPSDLLFHCSFPLPHYMLHLVSNRIKYT